MPPLKWFAPVTTSPTLCRRVCAIPQTDRDLLGPGASYTTMGIGLVASRLPFLLAGGMVLWVTYRIARSATGDSHTGGCAAAILASNIEFMESATKSTPDILQCLLLTVSIWGAVEIIFQQRRESRWYALLYVGAGMAIATKGILAVMFLLFVWGICPVRAHDEWWRTPHHALGMARRGTIVIALAWFIGSLLSKEVARFPRYSRIKSVNDWKALRHSS